MKIFSLLLVCYAAIALDIRAQSDAIGAVTVELSLEQDQFLPYEDVRVGVRITNRSGQTLNFGQGNDWLTFTVQARDNYVVSQLGAVPVEGEFSLDSSFAGTKRVNLTPYFDFRQSGRYEIIATVKIPQWKKEITSRPKPFDVIEGTRLREFAFGIPAASTNAQPEMRKYILQQAIYLKKMKLYLRLTDANGATLKVFPIAPLVSFSEPDAQVDRFSNLHVLSQIGARSFGYFVINPDGTILVREIYDYSRTRPKLGPNAKGGISVFGGVQRMTATNLSRVSPTQSPDKNAQTQKP
jgi:hypothetical protein